MKYHRIDEETKRQINGIPLAALRAKNAYAFYHELLLYGVNAIAHFYLMAEAKNVLHGAFPPEVASEIGLQRDNWGFASIPVKRLRNSGIFVPRQRTLKIRQKTKDVPLFNSDYRNRTDFMGESIAEFGRRITNQEISDKLGENLRNEDFLKNGLLFARYLWDYSVKGFEKYSAGTESIPKQPKDLTLMGRKLIDYYNKVADNCESI